MTLTHHGFAGDMNKEEWAKLFNLLGPSGTLGLAASATAGPRRVAVGEGLANASGVLLMNDGQITVDLEPNTSSLPRVDLVCLRANWKDDPSSSSLTYRKGVPAINPTAPAPRQDPADLWDVPIAEARVAPGQSTLAADDVVRVNPPRQAGFFWISSLRTAPDPINQSLIWYGPAKSLRVPIGNEYVEIAHARGVPQPRKAESASVINIAAANPAAPGSPSVGFAFTAPPSGKVYITISGRIDQNHAGGQTVLTWRLRAGDNVGSGTTIEGASIANGLLVGEAVVDDAPARLSAGNRTLIEGLTPGADYNVQALHWVEGSPSSGSIRFRRLIVEPVLN